MQPIPLEHGTRVRCVESCNEHGCDLVRGSEHRVIKEFEGAVKVSGSTFWHDVERFKPIIRIKAKCVRYVGGEIDREHWARGMYERGATHIFDRVGY